MYAGGWVSENPRTVDPGILLRSRQRRCQRRRKKEALQRRLSPRIGAMADEDEKEDMEAAVLKHVTAVQAVIDSRVGQETLATSEGQASLKDLHEACVELVGVPSVLQAAAAAQKNKKGEDGAEAKAATDKTVDMLSVPELKGLSLPDQREAVLQNIAQISMLDPPPMEADIMQAQLDFVCDRQAYWQHEQLKMETFYAGLETTLWSRRHQFEQRWLRFCSSSERRGEMGAVYEKRLANIDASIEEAELRVHKMARHEPLDEKRLRSDDLKGYHRHASHTRSVNVQVERLYKAVEWLAHRSGPEMIARAKDQQHDAAEENQAADGNVRDSVPMITDFEPKLDHDLRLLLEKFGLMQEDEEELAADPRVDPDGIQHDLLSDTREADLLSKVRHLFLRVFREQIPTLRFPPYSANVNVAGASPQSNNDTVMPERPDSEPEAGPPGSARLSVGGEPSMAETGGFGGSSAADDEDMHRIYQKDCDWTDQVREPQAPAAFGSKDVQLAKLESHVLGKHENLDVRLQGEMQYANEHSVSHAQVRIKEAAKRHGEIALIVAGLLPPPGEEPDPLDLPKDEKPPPLPVLNDTKLQSYYYLRTLEIRESKRRILMNLNFFRSAQRTLAKMAETRPGPITHETDYVQVDYDNYYMADDGVPLVRDAYGVNILHEKALEDMDVVQERMLKLGTHFIAIARSRDEGDPALLYVDTMGTMADLYSCEASYQEAKRAVVEKYFECVQHVSDPAQQKEFSALILDLMKSQPRLNVEADYFTEAYTADVVCANLHAELLKRILSDQTEKEQVYATNFSHGAQAGKAFFPDPPCPGEAVQLVPEGVDIGIFDFFPSLGILVKLPGVLQDAVHRIKHDYAGIEFDARLCSSLDLAVIQETLVEWQLLSQQDAMARLGSHTLGDDGKTPAAGSHHMEDPFILDSSDAIETIIKELQAELHPPNSKIPPERLEREAREMWILALHIVSLRNRLLSGVFETNILSSAYQGQMKAVKMGGKATEEELKLARGEISALAVDYLPNLAIAEFDGGFGVADMHTRSGLKKMLNSERVHDLHVALQVQLAQRTLLAVIVDYNKPLTIEIAMDSFLLVDEQPDPTKKINKESFLTVHRIKSSLKDRVLSDYKIKSKGETNVKFLRKIKYEVIELYCELLMARCRGFSMAGQIASVVIDLQNVNKEFDAGVRDAIFNVSGMQFAERAEGDEGPPPAGVLSDSAVNDMSKFFAFEGIGYDLWCLPDHHVILSVPKPDRSVGVLHNEDGMIIRYRVLTSIRSIVRTLKFRASLSLPFETVFAEPKAPVDVVVGAMRRIRKGTVQLGSGSTVMDLTQHTVEKSVAVYSNFLHTLAQLRDTLGKMGKEKVRGVVEMALAARTAEIFPPYSYDTFQPVTVEFTPEETRCDRQVHVCEARLFGTDGMVCRALVSDDKLSRAAKQLQDSLSDAERLLFQQMVAVTNKEEARVFAHHKISAAMQVGPALEASFEFFTAADALDKMSTEYFRLAGVNSVSDRQELFAEKIAPMVADSKAASSMSPSELLLLQLKFVSQEADLEMLRAAAAEVETDYASLTGKGLSVMPKPAGAVERFHEKVAQVARTLEDMKGSSEFMVNEDGEQAVIITESDLEANMDNLARSLRSWSEAQILTAANAQASRAVHLEHLLQIQENKTKYCNYLLQLQKKSFSRRVEADIIDKHFHLLLDMDALRRSLKQKEEDMAAQEPTLRIEIRAEFSELVAELTSKLAASKARFLEFHRQMTQKALANLNEVKAETMRGMQAHKVMPPNFKEKAQGMIDAVLDVAEAQEDLSQSQRAIHQVKSLYQLKEIHLKSEAKRRSDEIERAELLKKQAGDNGREQLEERVAMLEQQLLKTRELLSTTEVELKNNRGELEHAHRTKHTLMQWKMGAKKRISELEDRTAAVGGKAEAAMIKLRSDADRAKLELESLSGIEKRAEQRNAVVELKTHKELQRMKSTLAREQKLKLQAYARLEQLISDVSLGRSSSLQPGGDAEVWASKYQGCRKALERALYDNEVLLAALRDSGVPKPEGLSGGEIDDLTGMGMGAMSGGSSIFDGAMIPAGLGKSGPLALARGASRGSRAGASSVDASRPQTSQSSGMGGRGSSMGMVTQSLDRTASDGRRSRGSGYTTGSRFRVDLPQPRDVSRSSSAMSHTGGMGSMPANSSLTSLPPAR
eukprot:SAG22_NODE_726_length_7606_cov_64.216731_1_plen_2181_part_00